MRPEPVTVLVLLTGLALLLWLVPGAALTVFGGVLCGAALRAAALPIARRTPVSEGVAVLVVSLLLLALLAGGLWLAAGALAEEARQFADRLPRAWEAASARLRDLPGGDRLLEAGPDLQGMPGVADVARFAFSGVFGAVGGLGTTLAILLIGIYLAADPTPYQRGLLRLLAPPLRPRAEATLRATGETLRGWLLGQGFAMLATGILVFLGLWWLGVPLAGLLAVINALFGFVPYVGPLVGGLPAVLIAFGHDPSLVPWVIGLVFLVQNIEGNVLTPLVQQRSADIPPVLLLAAQLVFGTGLGLLGVVLAAPAAAALMTAIRVGYVEGWVEGETEEQFETDPSGDADGPRAP